mmetsp:Transcript_25694/g.71784  ORF Transcript_25694/g.71784 Transcript_25694/m.71784 type:complete len:111 (+) Transcript_25694:543-875(+)
MSDFYIYTSWFEKLLCCHSQQHENDKMNLTASLLQEIILRRCIILVSVASVGDLVIRRPSVRYITRSIDFNIINKAIQGKWQTYHCHAAQQPRHYQPSATISICVRVSLK